MKYYIVLCGLLLSILWGSTPITGQNLSERDEVILKRLFYHYNALLNTECIKLPPGEFMERFSNLEKQVQVSMDSLTAPISRGKAFLYNKQGVLTSLGRYVTQKDVEGAAILKEELEKRISDLNIDSPDLDLLSDFEIRSLLEAYYNWKAPRTSMAERSTSVLYNIKSEKVRRAYALYNYKMMIQLSGSSFLSEALAWDFELCSVDSVTLQEVRTLSKKYKTITKGQVAYDFEMEDEKGNLHRLSDFRGKYVFMDVWNTLCHVCVEDLPLFIRTGVRYRDKDVVFLTLSLDLGPIGWKKLLDQKNISCSIPHYRSTQRTEFINNYCIYGMPRYILVDPEGKIVDAWNRSPKTPYFESDFERKIGIRNE